MAGRMVEFASNGGTDTGYLATPASGKGPALLVIQEWWGLVDHIKDVADRFAAEGFVALAPDLYHGQATSEPDEAGKLMMAVNIDQAAKDLAGAASFLLAQPEVSSSIAGAIGYCMGGQLALYAAAVSPDKVGPVADYYGVHPSVSVDFGQVKGPLLGVFAEHDGWVSKPVVASLEGECRARGIKTDFTIYPGTQHGFFNDTRPSAYHAEAAADAWTRTLAFFRASLA